MRLYTDTDVCAFPCQVIAKAKDMHPKLALGMYIFFALVRYNEDGMTPVNAKLC